MHVKFYYPYHSGSTSIQKDRVTAAQVFGITILNCGTTGDIINSALSVLNVYSTGQFGVLVNYEISPGCVQVLVDGPEDVEDIDVCDLGKLSLIGVCKIIK